MSLETIASRYAQALYELGSEAGNADQVVDDVQRISELYVASDELRSVLDNPILPEAQRVAVLTELTDRLGLTPVVTHTLSLLAQRHRLVLLPFLAWMLRQSADEKAGIVRASVVSAAPLDDASLAQLQGELVRTTGKRVVIHHTVDPTLLGGLVTRIGDRMVDGSLRTQLATLKQTLLAS